MKQNPPPLPDLTSNVELPPIDLHYQGRIEHPRPPDFSGVDTLMPDYLGLSGRVLLSGIG